MSLVIELFQTDDYTPDGELPLVPLLCDFFRDVIGPDQDGIRFELTFLPVEDPNELDGEPSIANLRGSHGYVEVLIHRDGDLVYRHPHPVRELIGRQLRTLLSERDPSVSHWGFGIRGAGLEDLPLVRPAPEATHEIDVSAARRRSRLFNLEAIPDPEFPERAISEFAATAAAAGHVPGLQVVLSAPLARSFTSARSFSAEVEEGGFIAGHVFRDSEHAGGHIVQITAVIPAQRTGASMFHFTFTGDSFMRISEQIAVRGFGEQLLGWYHTHLFQASDGLGLSSVDVDLHRWTFRRPWQVAALVNITETNRRLRFYWMDGEIMADAPYLTVP